MIAPRLTRLVRVPDLRTFRRVVADLCREGGIGGVRRRAVIVPSHAAAEQLRRGLEDDARAAGRQAIVLPHLVTRDGVVRTAARRDSRRRRPMLAAIEREVLLGAAAQAAVDAGAVPPFTLRPGLVARMLEFYDGVRRHLRTVDDFERVVTEDLERDVETDRGAARMLEQTRFLVAAFRAYESALDERRRGRRTRRAARTPRGARPRR